MTTVTFGDEGDGYTFAPVTFSAQEVGRLTRHGFKSDQKELPAPDGSTYVLQGENKQGVLVFTVTAGKPPTYEAPTLPEGKKPDIYYFSGDRALYPTLKLKTPLVVPGTNEKIDSLQIASFRRTPVLYKGDQVLTPEQEARIKLLYLSDDAQR